MLRLAQRVLREDSALPRVGKQLMSLVKQRVQSFERRTAGAIAADKLPLHEDADDSRRVHEAPSALERAAFTPFDVHLDEDVEVLRWTRLRVECEDRHHVAVGAEIDAVVAALEK